jgi:hypothetical protein
MAETEDDIFMNQGKYMVEILKRFDMLDYKEIDTSIVSNLRLM